LRQWISTGTTLCYTAQIIAEFWNVATRPTDKRGGFGLSTTHVEALVQTIESGMLLLADETEEAVYREWRRIGSNHSVLGFQVYDARLVAVMRIHRIQYILTFNVKGFSAIQA
jgi:predicted nucleic acid-binding protein